MKFVRKLNLFDATMIVISGIIGSGIFINPYLVAQKVQTPFLILAVWVAGGLIALAGAFVFAELSTVMPKVGGQYAFFREAFHPLVAFLHGWSLLLIIQSGATFEPLAPPELRGFGLVSAFFAGLVPTMFSYGGWQNLNFVAEERRAPLRNLPRAALLGVLCVIAVYVGANVAYVHTLTAPALAATKTPAADVAAKLAGPFGAQAISFLVVISTFGFMNLALLSAPRVYYAMGADGVFFKSLGRLSPRFHAPTGYSSRWPGSR